NDSWWEDERPAYPIDLRYDYWIGRAPVTVAEYAAFVQATRYPTAAERAGYDWTWQHPHGRGSDIRGKHNHPVTQVDWHDALAFCDWLSEVSGLRVQLPSEAEWEKAARGGLMIPAEPVVRTIRELSEMHLNRELSNIRPKSTFPNPKPHRRYPWGDSEPDETRCNIEARVGDTTPVGRYSPRGDSPYGCVDMAGNVLEWCRSKY
ncbi:MAG: formylglycine-generating enzyme family protein, partial [Abditibacteriales bacterium]|nr:formylglycine-generating enzyme family protein [Abditibacteriales bacterium]MDW8368589.1 SUMF1/EgtB/PvdO family nonheme iron enzyme [Abditibacteriales bacterium]